MKQLLFCFLLILLFAGCHKNVNDSTAQQLNGRYKGTFHRTGMADSSQVTLTFKSDMHFDGTGGPNNYPAICGGNFNISNNSLVVDDTCSWTANFDWTLIFDGTYNINFTGENSVRIWRTNAAVTDEYLLSRFTR